MNEQADLKSVILMKALKAKNCDKAKSLVPFVESVDYRKSDGKTLLMYSSMFGYSEVVKVLLDNGAQTDLQSKYGKTALMNASENGHTEIVKLLLDKGAQTELQNIDGETALINALQMRHTDVIKLLLDGGAQTNIKMHDGFTALMMASLFGRIEVVKLLLDKGAQTNLQMPDGCTALMMVSAKGNTEIVRLLLDKGADINLEDNNGYPAWSFATNYEIRKMLESSNKKISFDLKVDSSFFQSFVPNPHYRPIFSWESVKPCFKDKLDGKDFAFYQKCPICGMPSYKLAWIKYKSPEETWSHLFGRGGPLSLCPNCKIQVEFKCTIMN